MHPLALQPMPEDPLISVLIANYNYAGYIGRAIKSVLNQTYQNFEIIVCDDGSKDNSLEVVGKYASIDSRIKVIAKDNGGQASALNAAFFASKGNIVSILDADDMWFSDRLARVKDAFLSEPQAGFVYHRLRIVDENGKTLRVFPKTSLLVNGWVLPQLNQRWVAPVAPASSISLHRSVAEQVFPLPEAFRSLADAVVAARSAVIAVCKSMPEPLGIWQQHGDNTTGYAKTKVEGIERYISMSKRVLDDMVSFAKKYYPLFQADLSFFERQSLGLMICMHALYSGKTMAMNEIRLYRPSHRALIWYVLFKLPRPLAVKIHQYWVQNVRIHSILSQM